MSESAGKTIYYEDLAVGRIFRTPSIEVTREEMLEFASRYDPQPFHLEEAAGRQSVFGGRLPLRVGLPVRLPCG
jgi:acyl dehydratase